MILESLYLHLNYVYRNFYMQLLAHYAFASGIMNLGFMIPGMLSGWIYQQVGYQTFFIIALVVAIPAFFLTWFVPFTNSEQPTKD